MYAPWTMEVRAFLARPELGLGRLAAPFNGSLVARARELLGDLSFEGALLAVLAVGLVTLVTRAVSVRGDLPSLLLLTWIVVPMGVFFIRGGAGVLMLHPRYWSFLFPACAIAAAVGIHAVAGLPMPPAMVDSRRVNGSRTAIAAQPPTGTERVVTAVVHVALVALVLVPIWPRLAREYRHAEGGLPSGRCPHRAIAGTGCRGHRRRTDQQLRDDRSRLLPRTAPGERPGARRRASRRSARRGTPAHARSGLGRRSRTAARRLRAGASGSPVQRHHDRPADGVRSRRPRPDRGGRRAPRLGRHVHPPQRVSRSVLDALARADGVSDNLLPSPAQSSVGATGPLGLQPREQSGGTGDSASSHGRNGQRDLPNRSVKAGETFITRFSYRNPELNGPQRVYRVRSRCGRTLARHLSDRRRVPLRDCGSLEDRRIWFQTAG